MQFRKSSDQAGETHDVFRGGSAIIFGEFCCGGIGVCGHSTAKLELIADEGINALKDVLDADQGTVGNMFNV